MLEITYQCITKQMCHKTFLFHNWSMIKDDGDLVFRMYVMLWTFSMQGEHCLYSATEQNQFKARICKRSGNPGIDLKRLKNSGRSCFYCPMLSLKKKNVTVCFVALGLKDSTLCTAHSTTILKFNRRPIAFFIYLSHFKGTVSRDFLLLVFFLNQFPPSLWLYH